MSVAEGGCGRLRLMHERRPLPPAPARWETPPDGKINRDVGKVVAVAQYGPVSCSAWCGVVALHVAGLLCPAP